MDHLRAGVGLLAVVDDGDGIKFALGIVAEQNAARIFPGDGRAGFHLRPGDARVLAFAQAALGHEIVNTALAVLVAGIPVLHRAVFDFRVVVRDKLHHRRVQLVFVPHRRGAAFEVAHLRAVVGHDERALELAGLGRIDAEIGRKLHRAAHTLRDITERAVGEDGGIQRGVIVVRVRHHRAEIFFDEIGMFLHGFAERAENNSLLRELFAIRCADGYGIKHRVHRDTGKPSAFAQWNAELLVSLQQLRVNLVQALRTVALWFGLRKISDVLKINFRIFDELPRRFGHGQPMAVGLEPPVGQPRRLFLLRRNQADGVLAQARRCGLGFDIGDEAVFVILFDQALNGFGGGAHCS